MHVIVWQFTVAPEHRSAFINAYGPNGDWAHLFRRSDGFRGTELLSCEDNPSLFLTIDHWASADDFASFQQTFSDDYRELDERFEALTKNESRIGAFSAAAAATSHSAL